QGRFKSFPIQEDDHLVTLYRYVERNPLRAHLVTAAETRRWGTVWHRAHMTATLLFDDGPIALPQDWLKFVSHQTESELAALRRSAPRGSPLGDDAWRQHAANALRLETTLRPRGRPWLGTSS